ncbi:hypothetical protein Acr_08g0017010 [Actinidia rufa]|uniref:Uncharacterized protein n=1 Tax=Actinidia rufa TaxID=165716 RepID=A0A7J0F3N4_9ERIC|nr:hypothetical protein Acr_08g0017010 [Actinidia rufa]
MKIAFFTLLLLLVITNDLAYGAMSKRKMMMVQEKPNMVVTKSSSSDYDAQPDINNHHTIPRQSWDSSQNHGVPPTSVQSGDGGSVNDTN